MIMYRTLISITSIFFILSFCFAVLGFYALDASLIIVSILFVIAGILFKLEIKELLLNPFLGK